MSKTSALEEFDDVNEAYEGELGEEDYAFIVGPDGELKSVFTPEKPPFETPENVLKLLHIFGIHDTETIDGPPTLH
jgi:hypothetical protein